MSSQSRRHRLRAAFSKLVEAGKRRMKRNSHLSIFASDFDEMDDDEENELLEQVNVHPERSEGLDSRKKWRQIQLNEIQVLVEEDLHFVSFYQKNKFYFFLFFLIFFDIFLKERYDSRGVSVWYILKTGKQPERF